MTDSLLRLDLMPLKKAGVRFNLASEKTQVYLGTTLHNLGQHIRERLIANSPKKTGTLAKGWELTDTGAISFSGGLVSLSIQNRTPYLRWVLAGTQPHQISAKPGGVLAFMSGGEMVFATSVSHPGTKPNPFVDRTIDHENSTIERAISDVGDTLIQWLAAED